MSPDDTISWRQASTVLSLISGSNAIISFFEIGTREFFTAASTLFLLLGFLSCNVMNLLSSSL